MAKLKIRICCKLAVFYSSEIIENIAQISRLRSFGWPIGGLGGVGLEAAAGLLHRLRPRAPHLPPLTGAPMLPPAALP
jgi:hypothetical protein